MRIITIFHLANPVGVIRKEAKIMLVTLIVEIVTVRKMFADKSVTNAVTTSSAFQTAKVLFDLMICTFLSKLLSLRM